MKKLVWILGMLPLIAIAWFYISVSHPEPKDAATVLPSSRRIATVPTETKFRPGDGALHGQELRDKINESMAEIAKMKTPAIQRKLVDALLKTRGPRYNALFESWRLESGAVDQVIGIIKEREIRFQEALQKHDMQGLPGGSEFASTRIYEKTLADVQLIDLLGESRFKELSQLEAKMESELLSAGRRIMNGRNGD